MRGTIGRTLSNPTNHYLTSLTKRTSFLLLQSSPFSASSSSGNGRGRGRGVGGASPSSPFGGFTSALGKSDSEDAKRDSAESTAVGLGHGRGRGTPLSSEPTLPSFSPFVTQNGSGRGRATNESVPPTPPPPPPRQAKQPIFIMKQDEIETDSSAKPDTESIHSSEPTFPPSTLSVASLAGAGRGKPVMQPEPVSQMKEENRHVRVKQQQDKRQQQTSSPALSKEEATKKAMGILSKRGESDGRGDMVSMSGGRGGGRYRGRGRSRGRGRGRGEHDRSEEEADEEPGVELFLGNNADGEKLAETIGADTMNQLVEGFEEMSNRVLPSPEDDAFLEAMHTNFMVSCSPFKIF